MSGERLYESLHSIMTLATVSNSGIHQSFCPLDNDNAIAFRGFHGLRTACWSCVLSMFFYFELVMFWWQ